MLRESLKIDTKQIKKPKLRKFFTKTEKFTPLDYYFNDFHPPSALLTLEKFLA